MFEGMNISEKLNAINDLCKSCGGLPGIPFWIPLETKIVRSVKGHGKTKLSELTYKPIKYCNEYARATRPNETAFYGCIGECQESNDDLSACASDSRETSFCKCKEYSSKTTKAYTNARVMSIVECSPSYRNSEKPIDDEKYTTSIWIANRPIQAICFITSETFPKAHGATIDGIRAIYEQNIETHKYSQKQIELLAEINKEFTKVVKSGQEDEYMITANLCHSCLYAPDADGIQNEAVIYASVQAAGELGLNVAIRPDVADNCLILDHVIEHTYDTQCHLGFIHKELSSIDMNS